jgi:hypothetical protein
MANELEILTENAAGDGWVDSVPGLVSSGYQAQNANIQARTVGQDLSSVRVSGIDIIVDISGPIDVDGLPFSVRSQIPLTPVTSGPLYIQVVAGATGLQKSLELTDSTPVWDADKNALYNGDNRVLNWEIIIFNFGPKLYKILDPQNHFGSITNFSKLRPVDVPWLIYSHIVDSFGSLQLSALTSDGENLIGGFSSAQKIYILNGFSSTILDSFSSPSTLLSGLTFDGRNLISCDIGTDMIYIHDGLSSSILSSFSCPYSNPTGLTFDGKNLISCSASSIYIHDGISATILDSFSVPGSNATALTYDGKNLISADSSTDRINFHDGVSSAVKSYISAPSGSVIGLAFDGKNLFSCDASVISTNKHGIS